MISKQTYSVKQKSWRVIFIVLILPFLVASGWMGYTIYELSIHRAQLKKDYSEINNIKNGLLSVDNWRDELIEIISEQIDQFEFNEIQQDTLRSEIDKVLNSLISQAVKMINEKQTNVGGKIKKFAFNTFVDVDNIRERVPEFSQTIIEQIKKPRSKEKLKFVVQTKLNEFAAQTRDSLVQESSYTEILSNYHAKDIAEFNNIISQRAENIQQRSYNLMFVMILILFIFLLIWYAIRNNVLLYTPMFTISVLLAIIYLFTGLAAPMIEIDARIPEINFLLIGKNIQFHDQVLFYQSKSIIDVVKILIGTGKADSIFVGILILIFSILFPVCKLLSTKIYLLGTEYWRNNKVIKFFAFHSGKWSMADVMVVAIFMAYIGFKGILDSELGKMNEDMNTDKITSIATNKTSLQPGFILFIAYVIFSLILSVILKRISKHTKIA